MAYGLDVLYGATTYLRLPFLVNNLASTLPDIGKASYYLHILGVITALPATASGSQQLVQIYKNGGLYEADGKTMRAKMRIGLLHAALNDVVLAASVWTWYTRNTEKYTQPNVLHVLLSCVMLPALLFSANLGGTLVYNYGAGLSIGKAGKSSKKA